MDQIVDSCIWVDLLRPSTKSAVRFMAEEIIARPSIALCEPIQFELLRLAPEDSQKKIEKMLSTIPMLTTPHTLWREATLNSRYCRAHGVQAGSMDLLIATICHHHQASLVTFDTAFEKIGRLLQFRVELIRR